MTITFVPKTVKSFVKRGGRLSNRQKMGLDNYLNAYTLPSNPEKKVPWDFPDIFGKDAPVFIEIGFGMGDALLEMALTQPEHHFIGIDVHEPGIGNLAAGLHDNQLTNVRIVTSDAVEMITRHVLPETVSGFFIFFPDPWHKKRHHKRRLITVPFITLLATCLKPGGFIHCATDWEPYAQQMQAVFSSLSILRNIQPQGGFLVEKQGRPLTKFEQRGISLGHSVFDLKYVK